MNSLSIVTAIKNKLLKLPEAMALRAFLVTLCLILACLLLGVFLFYQNLILVEILQPDMVANNSQFQYNTYQSVLKDWQTRQAHNTNSSNTTYSNPFN